MLELPPIESRWIPNARAKRFSPETGVAQDVELQRPERVRKDEDLGVSFMDLGSDSEWIYLQYLRKIH